MSLTAVERLAQTPAMQRLPAQLRDPFLLNNLVYFAGNFFAGLAGYAFQALLAGALGPAQFAEVASLLAIFYIIQILHFVAMAAAARITAPLAAQGKHSEVQRAYRDMTIYATLIGGAGMLLFMLFAPALRSSLGIGLGPLLILSATVPLNLLVGLGRGVMQGEQRFLPLSFNFFTYGSTTLVFLPVLLHFRLRAVGATLAIVLGLAICNLFAVLTLSRLPQGGHHERLGLAGVIRSSVAAAAGLSVITIFYNMDVLLAKHFLPTLQAGLYSGMSLLGKILFFGTISISAVMFPRVATLHAQGKSPHRIVNLSLGLVFAAGILVVAAYSLAPGLIIHLLLRRAEFAQIGNNLGIYALAMLGLAISNVLVYYFVGVHRRRFVFAMALGAVLFFGGIAMFHATLSQFTITVTVAINTMALVLLALYAVDHPRFQGGGTDQPMPIPVNVPGGPGAAS
jgi:O-antigen/teichoic acid export membrane protein